MTVAVGEGVALSVTWFVGPSINHLPACLHCKLTICGALRNIRNNNAQRKKKRTKPTEEERDISKPLVWKTKSLYLSHRDKHWKHFNGWVPSCTTTTCCTNCSFAASEQTGRGLGQPCMSRAACDPCASLLKPLINHPAMLIKWSWAAKQRPERANPIGKSRDSNSGGQYLPFLSQANTHVWLWITPEQPLGS